MHRAVVTSNKDRSLLSKCVGQIFYIAFKQNITSETTYYLCMNKCKN